MRQWGRDMLMAAEKVCNGLVTPVDLVLSRLVSERLKLKMRKRLKDEKEIERSNEM